MLDKTIDVVCKIFPFFEKFRQISKYLFFSVIATIVDICVLFILTDFIGIYYLLSSVISYLCGLFISFFGNKKYTFANVRTNKKTYLLFLQFAFISLLGLATSFFVIKISVEIFSIWYMLAKVIAIIITFGVNFLGHKFFVFR